VLYDANATPCVDSPPFGDGAPFCPTTSNGAFLFNASLRPYDVNRTIYSGFAEVRLPLGEKLEVTGAARYEQYQGFGDTFNPKIAARWQATDWLALRASASTTYRAPRATFLTNTFTRGLTNASGTYKANDLYGNANLEAEEAVTYSTGVLFDNDRIRASVDFWHFDFKNPMTTEAPTDLVARMFPTADGDTRCGNPTVAALQARFTFAGGVCGKANIIGYRTNYINGGGVKTSGLDFQAEADLFEIAGGQLTAGFDGTYLLTYDESTTPIEGIYANTTKVGPVINPGSASTDDRVGTFRASLFTGYNQTRGNAFLNYSVGDHNIRWQMRYISGLVQTESSPKALAAALGKNPDIAEYFQHDVTYRLNIPRFDAQLSASVQNVFDEEPPFAFGTQYNYDPGSGSPLGRIISVGLKKKF
jgi:iron complex outermembrane receptor protein